MEFKGNGETEIRMSSGFLSKMTRGFRQRESRVKWSEEGGKVKSNFLWLKTNCSCLFYRVPYHTGKEIGHLRSDSLTAISVGPQNELSIQTHNSTTTGYCSNYFVLAVVSMPTAHNYHPGGYPAFTVFLLVVESFNSGTHKRTKFIHHRCTRQECVSNVFQSIQWFAVLPSVIFDY